MTSIAIRIALSKKCLNISHELSYINFKNKYIPNVNCKDVPHTPRHSLGLCCHLCLNTGVAAGSGLFVCYPSSFSIATIFPIAQTAVLFPESISNVFPISFLFNIYS